MRRITDHWNQSYVFEPDPHDRGLINDWEPIAARLRGSGDAEAAELVEALAERLELPREPKPKPGKAFVLYQALPWADGIERRDREIASWIGHASALETRLERAVPWWRKAGHVILLLYMAVRSRGRGPLG